MSMEASVKERYSQGAQQVEAELCCPVDYDRELLRLLPAEIVERDYGCGDPSRYVRPGDVVLDLGSGGGKICYMAAQLVGATGQVIGIDMNDDMLALARRYQPEMAAKLGGDRVRFCKGRIQDLALDLDREAAFLADHPQDSATLAQWREQQRREAPMIADASVDLVISNCVLNLVDEADRQALLAGIYRVLRSGGRVAIADIVADAPPPAILKNDPVLWSGCISGAFTEIGMVQAFLEAGFVGICFDKWDVQPWRVVAGIEFRSVTLTAVKQPLSSQTEQGHAVIYRGPFARVVDELGVVYPVGQRVVVSVECFQRLGAGPFADHFILLAPRALAAVNRLEIPSDCSGSGKSGSRCC